MKEKMMEIIIELAQAGYEIRIGKSYFMVYETYKSESRDKYIEKEVGGTIGGSNRWEEGWHKITLDSMREVRKLLINPPTTQGE